MIKLVIFDLDDTLYPETDYVISGMNVVGKYLGGILGRRAVSEELLALFEVSRINVFDCFAKQNNLGQEVIDKCIEIYRGNYPTLVLPEQSLKILEWCSANGKKTGIITDGRPNGQHAKIQALGIQVDLVICTDEMGGIQFRKPCPAAFEKMLETFSVLPEEAVYIGDNIKKDFIAPNKLGMKTVQIKTFDGLYINNYSNAEYAMPDYVIACLDELISIIHVLDAGV